MSDTNPYETPKAQPKKQRPFPWMIVSAFLFVVVILMGMILWRSRTLRQVAIEREMVARQQAEIARQQAVQAMQKAAAGADGK
jgi:hypothetical protein